MFNKRKLVLITSMIMATALVFAGCGSINSEINQKSNEVKETKSIRIGTSGGYFPFTFVENDVLQGFEIDVWNEIGERLDYDVEFVTSKFSGLFGMLDTDRIDSISNQIAITEERKEKYIFTTPYVYDGAQLVVKTGNDSIKSLEDLKGKKVGVSLGSNYEQIIREFDVNNEIEIITYDGGAMEQEVALGRIDAFLMDKLSSVELIKKTGLDLQLAGDPVAFNENAFPFVKNEKNEELIEKINTTIEEMRADGTLSEISEKWLEMDITKK